MVTNTSPLASSRLGRSLYTSSASPQMQQRKTYNKRGSFGCTREVLHPLDPKAEPTAILYYDSSSEEEDQEGYGTQVTPTAMRRKKLLAEADPDVDISEIPAINRQDPKIPASARMGASLPAINESLLSKFSALGLMDGAENQEQTDFQALEMGHQPSPPISQLGTPQLTPSKQNILASMEDREEDALVKGMHDFLEEIAKDPEGIPLREVILRVESFIESLRRFAPAKKQIDYIIDQYTRHNIIPENKAAQLKQKCKKTSRMSATEILCRWLVYDRVYKDEKISTIDSSSTRFETPIKQNFTPNLNRKSFFYSPSNSRTTKSPLAENIASCEEKLRRLRDSADAVAETLKQNVIREHQNSVKYLIEHYGTTNMRTKEEASLDFHLQKLLDERKHQEQLMLQAKLEEERRRQEEERKRAEEAQAKEAKRKAEEEALKRAEIERQRRAAEAAEAARIQKQREEEEKKRQAEARAAKQAQEIARRKQEEEEKQAQQQQIATFSSTVPSVKAVPAASATTATAQATQYGRKSLELETAGHRQLLAKLKQVKAQVTADRELFKKVNVVKRAVNPKLGQLTSESAQIVKVRTFIYTALSELLQSKEGPTIEASYFQLSKDPRVAAPSESARVPVAFIWMVNELGKMVARQVEAETSVDVKTANPIGICIVSALSREPLIVDGFTFIDIVVARLWKKCPILQGVLGPEETVAQKEALGWKREGDVWEPEELHINRLNGYVGGFAAIAGRNFMKSSMNNPYPPFNLWFILAYFANNADKLTNTHYYCIKTMIEVAGDTIKAVYQTPGMKLINAILNDLADYGVKRGMSGASGLKALKAKVEKGGKFLG